MTRLLPVLLLAVSCRQVAPPATTATPSPNGTAIQYRWIRGSVTHRLTDGLRFSVELRLDGSPSVSSPEFRHGVGDHACATVEVWQRCADGRELRNVAVPAPPPPPAFGLTGYPVWCPAPNTSFGFNAMFDTQFAYDGRERSGCTATHIQVRLLPSTPRLVDPGVDCCATPIASSAASQENARRMERPASFPITSWLPLR